jgi:hypothetical protein
MFRTLKDLKDRVNELIESYGEDHGVAAWIFTDADVFQFDDEGDEHYLPTDDAQHVLEQVSNCQYIYEQIGEFIDDEIRRLHVMNKV